jgi:hypothetical protein
MDEHGQDARLALACLHGTVRHHVRLNPAQDSLRDVALAAVAALMEGRGDEPALLAETAGIMLGTARWPEDRDQAERSAELLKAAGADQEQIPRWVEEGRRGWTDGPGWWPGTGPRWPPRGKACG